MGVVRGFLVESLGFEEEPDAGVQEQSVDVDGVDIIMEELD